MIPGRSIGQKIKDKLQKKLKRSAQSARQAAKHQLDQVLLGLQHRGVNVKDSQDLAITVGRNVLKRAEIIRAQIANTPLSPAWLKEISLMKDFETMAEEAPAEATSMTEATVSKPAADMQAEQLHFESREFTTEEPMAPAGELAEDVVAAAIEAIEASEEAAGTRQVIENTETAGTIVRASPADETIKAKRAKSSAKSAKTSKSASGKRAAASRSSEGDADNAAKSAAKTAAKVKGKSATHAKTKSASKAAKSAGAKKQRQTSFEV